VLGVNLTVPLLVNIGQIILSIRCKDSNKHIALEALRRSRYKFPGNQKIIISKKWGFTGLNREDFQAARQGNRVSPDGAGLKFNLAKGPLDARKLGIAASQQ